MNISWLFHVFEEVGNQDNENTNKECGIYHFFYQLNKMNALEELKNKIMGSHYP